MVRDERGDERGENVGVFIGTGHPRIRIDST